MKVKSIRPFIGAKDFGISRKFYRAWGFSEVVLGANMSVFVLSDLAFYLQKYYLKDWVDNTMIFLESNELDKHHAHTLSLDLPKRFNSVRVSEIKILDWGREYFVHDPSGILWHIGEFKSEQTSS